MIQKISSWFRKKNKSTLESWLETIIIVIPIAFLIRTYFYGLYVVPTGSMETTMLVGERFFADKFSIYFWPIKRGDIISFNDPNYEYSDNPLLNLFQRYVWGPANWTKRVIGLPGERVQGKVEDGKPVIYINDKKLDESYVNQYPLIGLYSDLGGASPWHFRSYDPNSPYEAQPFYFMKKSDVDLAKRILPKLGVEPMRYPFQPHYDECSGNNIDEYDITLGENEYWALGDNRRGSWDSRFWGALNKQLIHGKIVFRIFSLDTHNPWWIFDIIKHPIDFWKRVRWSRCMQFVK